MTAITHAEDIRQELAQCPHCDGDEYDIEDGVYITVTCRTCGNVQEYDGREVAQMMRRAI